MHIATSGQSGQLLFFCPSGQHGISPGMADISFISPTGSDFAAAGATSGAATSPTITKTARRRPMSRRRFMSHHHTGPGTCEGPPLHMFARLLIACAKALKTLLVSLAPAPHPTFSTPTKCIKGCRLVFPKRTTSYRWGIPPSIPGDPAGIPGTANPMAVGRFSRSRRTAAAGTCPSSTYPSTSAVWQAARSPGTPSRFLTG
jgi:hypothetical protein